MEAFVCFWEIGLVWVGRWECPAKEPASLTLTGSHLLWGTKVRQRGSQPWRRGKTPSRTHTLVDTVLPLYPLHLGQQLWAQMLNTRAHSLAETPFRLPLSWGLLEGGKGPLALQVFCPVLQNSSPFCLLLSQSSQPLQPFSVQTASPKNSPCLLNSASATRTGLALVLVCT